MERAAERLEAEVEPGHDPEVPAGAAHAPEQVRLLGLARPDDPGLGGDQLDRGEVVEGEAEPALQPPDAATEREARDARMADDAHRAHETVRLRGDVELAEERSAVRVRRAGSRVDVDAAHRRQVDDEAAVAARVARGAVPARPDGDLEPAVPPEADRGRHVGRASWPQDRRGPQVVHRVPQPARIVVGVGGRRDDLATERTAQLLEVTWRQRGGRVGQDLHSRSGGCGSIMARAGTVRPARCSG